MHKHTRNDHVIIIMRCQSVGQSVYQAAQNGKSGQIYVLQQMFYLFFFMYFATRSLSTLGDNHHNLSPKIRGPTPKNLAPKTCKIWGDFTQLPTLITNISGMSQISKIRKICDRERFLPHSAKNGSLTTKYNK